MRKGYIYLLPLVSVVVFVGLAKGYIDKVKNDNAVADPAISEAVAKKEPTDGLEKIAEIALETVGSEENVSQETSKEQNPPEVALVEINPKSSYPLHKNITATVFWAGEEAGKDNKNISNLPSAWDEDWVKHFGGVDDPEKRKGYFPAKFTPKENPFYFALPYNDFDEDGKRKKDVFELATWAKGKKWKDDESVLKNQWIEIIKGGKTSYAQWQDVGPFKEDDKNYVFGKDAPKSKTNKSAGLDVSPAVKDYLGLSDIDRVDWRFVSEKDIPDGPWKKIVTRSQIYWR